MLDQQDMLAVLRAIADDLERGAAFAGPSILPDVITARQRALAAIDRATGFDPALVRIERKRFSVTQGEAEVFYGAHRLEQWGDDIRLIPKDGAPEAGAALIGNHAGRGDAFWIEAARKHMAKSRTA